MVAIFDKILKILIKKVTEYVFIKEM